MKELLEEIEKKFQAKEKLLEETRSTVGELRTELNIMNKRFVESENEIIRLKKKLDGINKAISNINN